MIIDPNGNLKANTRAKQTGIKYSKEADKIFAASKCATECLGRFAKKQMCKAFSLTANADGSLSCIVYETGPKDTVVSAPAGRQPTHSWKLMTKQCKEANGLNLDGLQLPSAVGDRLQLPAKLAALSPTGFHPPPRPVAPALPVPATNPSGEVANGPVVRKSLEEVKKLGLNPDELQIADQSYISPEDVDVSFDKIVGLEQVKVALRENVILPSLNPRVFQGPLLQPAKGILLFGPPGNGKTYIAKAVAHEAGANFLAVSVSDIGSKYHGEGERKMEAVFSLARKLQPTVIFFDEVDSLLSKRSDTEHDANRKIKTEFLTALDGMSSQEGERILALAATNLPYSLDDAALRRFPERFFVELPGEEGRLNIIKKAVEDPSNSFTFTEADMGALAKVTPCYSGSDLTNLIQNAMLEPLMERARELNDLAEGKLAGDDGGSEDAGFGFDTEPSDLRPVTVLDLYSALKQVKPQANAELLTKLIEWNQEFGAVKVQGSGSATGEKCAA